jgi:hypothetical protein
LYIIKNRLKRPLLGPIETGVVQFLYILADLRFADQSKNLRIRVSKKFAELRFADLKKSLLVAHP